MTQSTEQERAEFEAWLNPEYSRELDGMDCYIDGTVYSMFSAWQAARRAPSVPTRKQIEQYLYEQGAVTVSRDVAEVAGLARLAGMQAARRVQVVPVPLSDELPKGFISDVLTAAGLVRHGKQCKSLADRLGDAIEKIWAVSIAQRETLAAAPQPPAPAPAELPEPFAITWHDSIQYPCGFPWFDRDKYPDGTKLYTEQQVRQLLADHGVK